MRQRGMPRARRTAYSLSEAAVAAYSVWLTGMQSCLAPGAVMVRLICGDDEVAFSAGQGRAFGFALKLGRAGQCIQRYEGPWNDPNPPYFGGLQMDYSFMATYGPHLLGTKGTADKWTPLEQMWVAERAHRSGRGYYPWPNTARYCGLI